MVSERWSVSEAEVKPLASTELCRPPIFGLLIWCHRIPSSLSLLVPPCIVALGSQEHGNGQDIDNDKVGVTSVVQRLIVVSVDEVANNVP